jgi:hypothetical protein
MSQNLVPVYDWVNDPPVVFVQWAEVATRVQTFQSNLVNYGVVPGGTDLSVRMNAHSDGAQEIAGLIVTQFREPERPVFEYRVAGQPIALMQIDIRGSGGMLEIKNVATHPGTEGAGGIMMEYALNKVTSYNDQMQQHAKTNAFAPGHLYLETYNAASTAAYLALGFTVYSGRKMILDAANSVKWGQINGKWRLVGKPAKYLTTV